MALIARGQITIRVAVDTYSVYQTIDKAAIACDHTGKVLSSLVIHSVISVRQGETPVSGFNIGAISTPTGFTSITVNQSTKTVSYTVSGGNSTLADTGTISIPVVVNGQTFTISFGWYKVRSGAPGNPGVDASLLDWVADWNSGKTVIDGQSLITPKIFAGMKNSNGTVTGMAIGRFALSTRNASGTITKETVNGIYGFADGKKTFAVEASGNVQLGNGNEYIKYNVSTGKVEFGSNVSLNWVNAISQAKTEAINSAANTAQVKADAAKAAAISTAASNTDTKISELQVGSDNLLPNGDLRYYSNNNNIGWDNALNGTYVIQNWGSGYNSGVTAPTTGYHAHLNISKFGFSVLEFINKNSIYNQTKRWMGISTAVHQKEKLMPGCRYTFSADLMVDTAGMIIHGGIYSTKVGKTAAAFSSGSYSLGPSRINQWQRVSYTFTLDAEIDLTKPISFYIYGYSGAEGIAHVKNISLQLGTKGSWGRCQADIEKDVADAKKTGTDARTVADALTNKANTEGWATKLTYIGSTGIFTGTLSANTVNAIRINASQITAGTIAAARIDVNALKASLITAGNIEALTLNVTKGKIGGWSLDADSIFRGTKNNASGGYTSASGSITIGSTGIRGMKWRLESTGAGAIAGSNIVWDAAGNVTFSAGVRLLWSNAAVTAANSGKLYVRGTGLNHSATRKMVLNGTVVNESSARGLTLTVIARDTLVVNSTTNYDVYSSDTNCNTLATALNALGADKIVILTSYDAIRINAALNTAIQRCGGSDRLITDARNPFAFIGIPGIGKNNGLFALYGLEATEPYAELSTLVVNGIPQGISVNGQRNTFINGSGIYTGTLNANQISAGTIDTSRLNTTELKATLITAANIQALTLNVTKGTIGGWTIGSTTLSGGQIVLDKANKRIAVFGASSSSTSGHRVQLYYNSNTDFGLYATNSAGTIVAQIGSTNRIAGWVFDTIQIYKNNVYLSSDGSIYNGMKWRLNNDGSGRIANGNIIWDAAGNVTFGDSVSLKWKNDIEAAKTANYGYRYYKKIVINGESGKYYPVVFKGGDQSHKRTILIRRAYSEQAPSDWDSKSATHMGGLILSIMANFGGWGGASYSWDIYELSECYSRMFAGAAICGNSCMFAIFLRGGGTTGAVYHIYSDQTIENGSYSPSPIPSAPQIAYASDQIFQSGDYKAYAPAPRTLTASVEEEIRRHRFIVLAQGNDSTLTAHPLTYIGSTGIYTGTLTANQINAGTISVDRIAAGSITSSKLDASSIKANIINTSYINGLSCTFTKGSIGGWTIGSDNISNGNLGVVGATPIQIRKAAAGSGYWYTGAYKPLGITMTWHQSNNAGHIVFGQVAASGSTVKTGFIGIQMMSWDHLEYFCLSANYSRSGSKEVYNRIAGWAFDNQSIWKNSVYLGSDGSLYNGTKWRLNNDGSGRLANGNIVWDASGNVSFGSSVTLNWTNAATNALNQAKSYADTKKTEAINSAATDATNKANAAKELASAMAFGKMLYRDPTFYNGQNGINVYNNSGNGTVTIARISDSTAPNDSKYVLRIVNTGSASPGCGGFYFGNGCSYRKVFIARIIAKIPVGRNIQWASNAIGSGGSSKWLTSRAGTGDWAEYVYKVTCGTSSFSSTNFFYIEGSATLTWYVAYATVFDVTSTEKYTTTIDANGIYTSTLNANQITAGTISADRIAAGSINSTKLDAASIKANIINTSYINGLTCTFVRGSIGGWNLSSSSIAASSPSSGHRVVFSSSGYMYNDNPSTGIDYWGLKSDGSATFGYGKISFAADGSGRLANGNITWDAAGNVQAKNAIFNNVRIQGSVRNKFVLNDSSIWIGGDTSTQENFNNYDNIVAIRGSWDESIALPWSLEQSGRRVTLVNYKWGSNTTVGYMTITAPSGKYFFEDGIQKTSITFSRELVELLGYGDNATFFGWIVINRRDMMCTGKYGSFLQVLASGIVTLSGTSVSLKQKTFDGSRMSVSRTGTGRYTVYLPWSLSSNFFVQMTGYYTGTPIYATIMGIYSSYFYVQTQDDSSANEGSFCFQVFSTADWS